MKPVGRTRSTVATRKRVENIKFLIAEMRTGAMTAHEMAIFLSMSPSGVRKYLADLTRGEVIVVERHLPPLTPRAPTIPVYGLVGDEETVQRFIEAIEQPVRPTSDDANRSGCAHGMKGVHLAKDDTYFRVRRASTRIPPRDPLVAALFGPSKA